MSVNFDDLKCSLCDMYLTVVPIYSISKDGEKTKCGRCKDVPTDLEIRNFTFEKIIMHYKLPCGHENCDEKLQWEHVAEHEAKCSRRRIQCPMTYKCKETILLDDLSDHFFNRHRGNFFDTELNYKRLKQSCVFLLVFDRQVFIVLLFFKHPHVNVGDYSINEIKTYKYNYKTRILDWTGKTIVQYKQDVHCFECLLNKCKIKSHVFSKVGNVNILEMFKFNIYVVMKLFGPTFNCNITIDT